MANPPTVRQITRESVGEVPAWFERVLAPLNAFLQQMVDAVSNGLTPGQNFAQQWMDLTVVEGSTTFQPQAVALGGRPVRGISVEGVTVLAPSAGATPPALTYTVGISWKRASVQQNGVTVAGFQLTSVVGLPTGSTATLTLLVKAE